MRETEIATSAGWRIRNDGLVSPLELDPRLRGDDRKVKTVCQDGKLVTGKRIIYRLAKDTPLKTSDG